MAILNIKFYNLVYLIFQKAFISILIKFGLINLTFLLLNI